jgi:pyruvate dehydrogenase E2 component (dihydrolipoamide acetyltransferase)
MAQKVIMPKQGLQMTEGIIIRWLVQEGSAVKEGEPLFEMETDKLAITIDAAVSGTLLKIVREKGETVPITETIAVIGEAGEDYSSLLIESKTSEATEDTPEVGESASPAISQNIKNDGKIYATPLAKKRLEEKGINIENVNGTGPEGLIIERDILSHDVVKVTPTANKIAELEGVLVDDIEGSGINGKIMKTDVINYLNNRKNAVQSEKVIEISGMRKAIFNNMFNSLHTMAQANHKMKVDMSETVRFREKLKENGKKVSYTDILVKVVSRALVEFPMLNSSVVENMIVQKHYVNMGIAVALPNGLIVPNLKNSHLMSLEEISENIATLAKKAREGKLSKEEYSNGTFTITNLGMYDLDEFTAVINPPEAAILAIGKIAETPVCVGKAIEVRPILTISLTYDHRIIDGAPAAEFLQYIKKLLQTPYLLI